MEIGEIFILYAMQEWDFQLNIAAKGQYSLSLLGPGGLDFLCKVFGAPLNRFFLSFYDDQEQIIIYTLLFISNCLSLFLIG